jgi:hypothetical protein
MVNGKVEAACLGNPWDVHAWVIRNPKINVLPRTSIGPLPWALEIVDPTHPNRVLDCAFSAGTASVVAGMRANWECNRPGRAFSLGTAGLAFGTPKIVNIQPMHAR